MSEDLPKQELLIKLLKMTTSPNDGEALIAVRKANDLLKSAAWDWEKLIHGKIKVIEDPFKSVETPVSRGIDVPPPVRPAPPRPQAPKPAPPPRGYSPVNPNPRPTPPPPPRQPQPIQPLSTKDNLYAGWCYCCGDHVAAKGGWIFDPSTHNRNAKSKWQICCNSCNNSTYRNVGPGPAIRNRNPAAPSLSDI